MEKKTWLLNAMKQCEGQQAVMREILMKLLNWCTGNDERESHLPRDEDKINFLKENVSWFLTFIEYLLNEQDEIAQILKELLDWCFDDDEHGSHNPRNEDKVKDVNKKLSNVQKAQEGMSRHLDVQIAVYYDLDCSIWETFPGS